MEFKRHKMKLEEKNHSAAPYHHLVKEATAKATVVKTQEKNRSTGIVACVK